MREKTVENKIKEYLFTRGIYHFKVHGSKFMTPGIADIISCVNGHFVAIEVKRPGGRESEQQKVHRHNVIKSNGISIVADCVEDVMAVVEPLLEGEKNEFTNNRT